MFLQKSKKAGNVWVSVSIIAAAIIIGIAIMLTSSKKDSGSGINFSSLSREANAKIQSVIINRGSVDLSILSEVTEGDYYVGNLNAPIKIVEYSDTECPFCAVLHKTLQEVVTKYDGKVVWVYRHLPLTQLHQKAAIEAHAAECAGAMAGNDGFWKFLNRLYEVTPSNDRFDLSELPFIAEFAGLDVKEFNTCMTELKYIDRVISDYTEVVKATGGQVGTPFNVIFTPDGQRIVASGALPLDRWISIIDGIIANGVSESN